VWPEGGSTNSRQWVWTFWEIFLSRRVKNSVSSQFMRITLMWKQRAELQVWIQYKNTSARTTTCSRRLELLILTSTGLLNKSVVSQLCPFWLCTLCADCTSIPIPTWMKSCLAAFWPKFTKDTGVKLSITMTFTQQMCFKWFTFFCLKAICFRLLSWMN